MDFSLRNKLNHAYGSHINNCLEIGDLRVEQFARKERQAGAW